MHPLSAAALLVGLLLPIQETHGAKAAYDMDYGVMRTIDVLPQHAPKFFQAMQQYAPHLLGWLDSPPAPYTLFVPVDEGCTVAESASGSSKDFIDAVFKYHVVPGVRLTRRFWDDPGLLETSLVCQGPASAPLCHLPAGKAQVIKAMRDENGIDTAFDGALPEATIFSVCKTRDATIVFLNRTLFPPMLTPAAVAGSTPLKHILDTASNYGLADFRTSALTVFLPPAPDDGSPEGAAARAAVIQRVSSDPQVAGNYVVPGVVYSSDLEAGLHLGTLVGTKLRISDDGEYFAVNGVRITYYDIPTSFGVVHVLERELPPPPGAALPHPPPGVHNPQQLPFPPGFPARNTLPKPDTAGVSFATPLMVAGALAVAIGIGYVACRRSQSTPV